MESAKESQDFQMKYEYSFVKKTDLHDYGIIVQNNQNNIVMKTSQESSGKLWKNEFSLEDL